jgi:hypothetical protein
MADISADDEVYTEPEKPHYDPANPIDAKNEPSRGGDGSTEAEPT